jgi:hypothetical protein
MIGMGGAYEFTLPETPLIGNTTTGSTIGDYCNNMLLSHIEQRWEVVIQTMWNIVQYPILY